MRGSSVLQRPEAVKQNMAKILTAFLVGLVTVFGSALVYSNLQQERDLVPAVNLPESPTQEDRQQTTPSTKESSPEPSPRNTVIGGQSAETALPSRPHSLNGPSPMNPQRAPVPKLAASAAGVRLDVPPVIIDSFPRHAPYSMPIREGEGKDTPGLAQHAPSVEQSQRAAAEPPQTHPESVSFAPLLKPVVVPATTTLAIQLAETLSSDRNQLGDTFRAKLAFPLVVDGYLLAETGATVLGRVETSHRASMFGKRSELSVSLTAIDIWNGQQIRVETGWREVKGTRNMLTNTAFREDHAGSGLRVDARTAVLPAGAELTFILTAPLTATGTRQR